ncbi:DUF7691 family protein [Deinococcus radiophilus]|uniref:DUF7691 domain-containing protein n=1 Tax=Deinococcus radiophilus TaxID=32062 RepID=A0A3S0KA42_9DEIO|nr:hypothetical protein [Deinococcus radiophilus]RTR26090.1 hypothetical protein EJ104_08830 [Deinococcus radiophilus]UFA51568.1 hypothetical protein LMT64_12210 [Deinococcus radiophilus]
MSSILQPYAVPLNDLRNMIGSGDVHTFVDLHSRYYADLLELDEQLDGSSDAVPAAAEDLLHDLIHRPEVPRPQATAERAKLLYILELMCRRAGKALSNRAWSGFRESWATVIDGHLTSNRVAFRTQNLLGGTPPLGLYAADDYPGVSSLTPEQCQAALDELLPLSPPQPGDGQGEDMAESLAEVRDWLKTCAEGGQHLICFFY